MKARGERGSHEIVFGGHQKDRRKVKRLTSKGCPVLDGQGSFLTDGHMLCLVQEKQEPREFFFRWFKGNQKRLGSFLKAMLKKHFIFGVSFCFSTGTPEGHTPNNFNLGRSCIQVKDRTNMCFERLSNFKHVFGRFSRPLHGHWSGPFWTFCPRESHTDSQGEEWNARTRDLFNVSKCSCRVFKKDAPITLPPPPPNTQPPKRPRCTPENHKSSSEPQVTAAELAWVLQEYLDRVVSPFFFFF